MPGLVWFEHIRPDEGFSLLEFDPECFYDQVAEIQVIDIKPPYFPSDHFELLLKWHQKDQPLMLLAPKSPEVIGYKPLEEYPGLFLEFAELECKPESVVRFASQYGRLDPYQRGQYVVGPNWDLRISNWYGYIEEFRSRITMWETAKRTGDYSRLIRKLNSALATSKIDIRAVMIPGLPRPDLRIIPEGLHGAMELQFAQAVSSTTNFRKCAACPRWFAYGTGTGRRKSAHYCSPACQKAHWMKRHEARKN